MKFTSMWAYLNMWIIFEILSLTKQIVGLEIVDRQENALLNYKHKGKGYCPSGYYKGWTQDADHATMDEEKCAKHCNEEPECLYFAVNPLFTCSRYNKDAGDCQPNDKDNNYDNHELYKKNPNIVSLNGACRYGSDESQWIKTTYPGSAIDCRRNCKDTVGCTAVAYKFNTGDCMLYKGGPYTHTDNSPGYTCYPLSVSCETRGKTSDCSGIRDRHTCLTTTESRDIKVSNVQLKGSVCGWCPNGPCKGNTGNECEPKAWLDANEVTVFETCEIVAVRLVDGKSKNEGRVEIYHQGDWGTVCNDDWDINDANVICRMLGYPGTKNYYNKYGEASPQSPIMMDNVNCAGTEDSIDDCKHNGYKNHDCGHSEDIGVICAETPSISCTDWPESTDSTCSPSATGAPDKVLGNAGVPFTASHKNTVHSKEACATLCKEQAEPGCCMLETNRRKEVFGCSWVGGATAVALQNHQLRTITCSFA